MSYAAFRRVAVDPQVAEQLQVTTIPAPTRGLTLAENENFMQPGGALVMDNWRPTLKGASIRGGSVVFQSLPETTDVVSMFTYQSGSNRKMFAGNATKLYDVTGTPSLIQSGQGSGNYSASQLANAAGDFLTVVNDAGDFPLRFDGTTWTQLNAGQINGPGGTAVVNGQNLVHVCKYRNRLFFVEKNSFNAWCLGLNAIGGTLALIPLSGAATKGGKLLSCATWSIDAGDGIDDKIVFITDQGELLIFTGGDPSVATDWRQEGRYDLSPPMGKNATVKVGGELLHATVAGIIPTSAAITKSADELELAAVTRNIKSVWTYEVANKNIKPWTMCYWHDYGAIFVTTPGGAPGARYCYLVNAATGAWARYTNWDATCFCTLGADMFFGTQGGKIMQADRTGFDDGFPYTCSMISGWEIFQSPSQQVEFWQARVNFQSGPQQFNVQISACKDFLPALPPAPVVSPAGASGTEGWDIGVWDTAVWDGVVASPTQAGNTGWVSVGVTGYSHAYTLQVTIGQLAKPVFDFISVSATYKRMGINV